MLHTMLLPQRIIIRLHMAGSSVALLLALMWLKCRLQAAGMTAAVQAMLCCRAMALIPFPAVWSCLVV
jgi:hypothetical protein